MRSAEGLPGVLAGNPMLPDTLRFMFISAYIGGSSDYAYLHMARRVDIDRLYGLMIMRPEWDSVTTHGSYGTGYKTKTWEHMSPFEIKALFKPEVAKGGLSGITADGLDALGDDPFPGDRWDHRQLGHR